MEKVEVSRTERLRIAHDKLQTAVAQIASGDDWKKMLRVVSQFHRYSFNNHLMIFVQRPDATILAGFNKWKSLGRFVRKGEKGIGIFAPCRYKTPIGELSGDEPNLYQIRGFRIVHVFDISQTEGDTIPDLDAVRPKLLEANAPEGIWDALVTRANAAGFQVIRDRRGSENGYCDFSNKEIGVRADVGSGQAVKTLIHELAHALLHSDGFREPEVAEIEVESVAYVVCDAIGLDSSEYSFTYIAHWAEGDCDLLKTSAQRVTECATGILRVLEGADGIARQENSEACDSDRCQ
ncbi:MAG: hypothetical protein QOG54_1345 [Actinomycetota bacterium]|nr:hypothetical protein [Actinomycetota bacterium]